MRSYNLFGEVTIKNQVVYAMPYMGNKRKLATRILNAIYYKVGDFNTLYDLFGGGGSISVAGLIAGHNVIYNEFNTGISNLMKYIKNGGKLPNKWITREEFNQHKDGDDWYSGFIKCCWSFGNSQKAYLFGKEIEELKRLAHEYLLENGYDGTEYTRIKLIKKFKREKEITDRFELQQLEQLQQLQQLERLEQLKRLEQLDIQNKSYIDVEIKEKNCVIYCDPPYKGTAEYQKSIDYDEFYKWCLENENPVFISEYNMPKEFIEIAQFKHRSTLSANSNNEVIEKLYWNGKKVQK